MEEEKKVFKTNTILEIQNGFIDSRKLFKTKLVSPKPITEVKMEVK
jgi:hypothetical protein